MPPFFVNKSTTAVWLASFARSLTLIPIAGCARLASALAAISWETTWAWPSIVARKIADLLLVDGGEPTPLQAIVEKEFAKVIGASARTSLATARKSRAGVLAATLVDPFGILEPLAKSKLLAPDRDDKVALATLARVADKANPELAASVAALNDLGADDQQKVLAELADIIWQNRDGASRATRRIATLVLQQAAGRLQA